MRYLLCLIGGVLLGAMLALTLANTLQRRSAWPRAVMNVMQHELGEARDAAQAGRCASPLAQSAIEHLKLLSTDLERAILAPDAKDRVFSKYADDLREAIAQTEVAGSNCSRASEALTAVKNACDACHRDYR